ncbi:alcohol oxidase-like protein [Trametes versicolor FP-101664 SS1]|uniref:alcohol oxidase-like protein n=1 Tax=Trametes versicolor (strain FP-101664) TaxID=717944 RepID=UPI00046240FF|nr:alcohol oxidase-like protein [Trametes versicolor FP-101664 SS1]EIW56549.1 alcohol oxidase-like protein [Trametes versicolor FP-101664 SS1]
MTQATYDIIIAGGGTCGCIIAGRLAAADPSLSILVIESGPPTRGDPLHIQPAHYLHHLRPDSTTVKFQVGRESAALGGRAPIVPCGQCLGGGSSVNFTMYTRASASDYDDWENVYGNPGWGSADLLPLLRKCETYQVEPGKPTHGYSGPLKISQGGFFTETGKEFLDVAAQYDKTRGQTDDVNGLFECDKYGVARTITCRWIDAKTGTRSDVPHHYIYNQDFREDQVRILTGYDVKKILFEGKRAVGVEYIANSRFNPDAKPEVLTATARRLVVISAGAFGSPAILERSGVGSKEALAKVGVEQIIDLPGVGESYQDHQVIFGPYVAADDVHTLDGIVTDDKAEIAKWTKEWKETGSGLIAHNGLDAGVKMRPNEAELSQLGEKFRQRWQEFYVPAPDKPVLWMGTMSMFLGDRSQSSVKKGYSIGWYIQYPMSLGHVHITSADDVQSPLDFHPGYLDSPEEMTLHKWGYKRSREFARRLPSYRGEVVASHPVFAPSSKAATGPRSGPVPVTAPDIEYTAEDEVALEAFIRRVVATAWHSIGTCAMKKREDGGVVDSKLNVYGVEGLKVTDASICPGNVGANVYSTAVLIGEKAAMIIAEELGITLQDD